MLARRREHPRDAGVEPADANSWTVSRMARANAQRMLAPEREHDGTGERAGVGLRGVFLPGPERAAYPPFTAFSTASAWPGTFTLRQILAILPFSSMRKVERSTPIYLRPYMLFSTHTP